MIIILFSFWACAISFDLHTTFKKRELLQYETNPIMTYFLKKTTIKKSIICYISLETLFIVCLPIIYFWKIDFVLMGIFGVLLGVNHIIAGISNKKLINTLNNS